MHLGGRPKQPRWNRMQRPQVRNKCNIVGKQIPLYATLMYIYMEFTSWPHHITAHPYITTEITSYSHQNVIFILYLTDKQLNFIISLYRLSMTKVKWFEIYKYVIRKKGSNGVTKIDSYTWKTYSLIYFTSIVFIWTNDETQ